MSSLSIDKMSREVLTISLDLLEPDHTTCLWPYDLCFLVSEPDPQLVMFNQAL